MPTKGLPKKVQKSYARGATKYHADDPKRFQWYSYSHEQMKSMWSGVVDLIPDDVTKVLEVGCGCGHLATILKEKRPDVAYTGFDIVHQNIKDAVELRPGIEFYQGNYWNVLSSFKEGDWDFVISVGAMFTSTGEEYVELLFDLLEATSPKGFVVLTLGSSWRLNAEQKMTYMERARSRSKGVTMCYYKGKRDWLSKDITTYNQPLVLHRQGWFDAPVIPDILPELLEFELPEESPFFKTE